MFYLIHALVGCIIGKSFNSVPVIILISIASHFLLDMIPHWDSIYDREFFHANGKIHLKKSVILIEGADFLASLLLVIFLSLASSNPFIALGAFFSLLPDITKLGYFTGLRHNRLFMSYLKFHSRIQKDTNWKLGIFIQILFVLLILFIFF